MSETEKIPVFYSNRTIVRGFVGAVLVAALLLILPLSIKVKLLQREILLQQLEINKLSSLEALAPFAEESGLDLNGMPTKVRITGGSK